MRGFLFYLALSTLIPGTVQGMEPEGTVDKLDSAVVMTSRAGKSTPVTFTMVSREELRKTNPVNSLPMALSLQPSVVSVNEGGTGLGYSKMSVRGIKGSQINVTLNGITLNDAESQEVFWVNIPSLTNFLSSVQLQRGLGTSASGPGAFGASVNMSTASVGSDSYAAADFSYGSYSTFTTSAAVGTGLMKNGIYMDFAYSRGLTDGYIRNAFADVQSALGVLGWMNEKNSLRLTWLYGDQHTGITWNGIDLNQYEIDRRFNSAGMYEDEYGNIRYYDNDSDNYTQHHLQLNYTRQINERIIWTSTLNYTLGKGYFENYKTDCSFADFNFTGSSPESSDFIVREAMANDYFVFNTDVRYNEDAFNLSAGINLSRYDGDHIGKVLWSEVLGDDYDYVSHKWYLNTGLKQEANAYLRAEYVPLSWLTAYADLQYRGIWLDMEGPEDDQVPLDYSVDWHFLNPRAGLTFNWNPTSKAYLSAALGHREPGRADIKENIKTVYLDKQAGIEVEDVGLKSEKMLDVEIGYTYSSEKISLSANVYLMEYWDMLLETGKLSNVGYAIKDNVDRGWRRGVEIAAAWSPFEWLESDLNLTVSSNQIKDYKAYLDNINYVMDNNGDLYMNWVGGQKELSFGKTRMLMSPSVTGMVRFAVMPWCNVVSNSLKTTTLSLDGKYVGKQYLDNTMTDASSVPAYFVSNLSVSHEFDLRHGKIGIAGYVNNIFNNMYYADGWAWNVYNVDDDSVESYPGIYPQAPLNLMLKISYRF